MRCDNCNKETPDLDLVFEEDNAKYFCAKCKKKLRCPACGKRKNRLVLLPKWAKWQGVCTKCYRRIYA